MPEVLVDTSAWYALLSRRDDRHQEAAGIFRRLRDEGARLVTHNYVVVETTALVSARLGREAARRWLTELLPVADAIWVGQEEHNAAVSAFSAGSSLSLVDLLSIEVARRRNIPSIFAFDADFAGHGFQLLGP